MRTRKKSFLRDFSMHPVLQVFLFVLFLVLFVLSNCFLFSAIVAKMPNWIFLSILAFFSTFPFFFQSKSLWIYRLLLISFFLVHCFWIYPKPVEEIQHVFQHQKPTEKWLAEHHFSYFVFSLFLEMAHRKESHSSQIILKHWLSFLEVRQENPLLGCTSFGKFLDKKAKTTTKQKVDWVEIHFQKEQNKEDRKKRKQHKRTQIELFCPSVSHFPFVLKVGTRWISRSKKETILLVQWLLLPFSESTKMHSKRFQMEFLFSHYSKMSTLKWFRLQPQTFLWTAKNK